MRIHGGADLGAFLLLLLSLRTLSSGANNTRLASDEVEALKVIGSTLRKGWDFSVDPCSGEKGWISGDAGDDNVTCGICNSLSSNNTISVCHVVSITLRRLSLQGSLPPELVKLPHLQTLDLTQNYLNGSIPPQWGTMAKLNTIVLGQNRLTGSIPMEIGNISSLSILSVEQNMLSGTIPSELGNLSRIQRLMLNSNYFNGELPPTFAKLTALKDFWLGDNQLIGKLPDFMGNWISLQTLFIQASGLQGPIPPSIARLGNLTDLRISDLNGTNESQFPKLNNTSLVTLILRSCNLIGKLPKDLANITTMRTLDVSFNKLSGEIPDIYQNLKNLVYMYLTGNLLSGPVPKWIIEGPGLINVDLSYNNFTTESLDNCQQNTVNLFSSSSEIKKGIIPCVGVCQQSWRSLFINCGGNKVTINYTKYEDDLAPSTPSKFSLMRYNWAYSTTGHFLDGTGDDNHITTNQSILSPNTPQLYMTARRSPISITYYGFCLVNGKYIVNLHFAEIIFTSDETYSSLGRRFFDIYIQRKLVQKDFNIEDEAGGVGKAIVKTFNATVSNGTLEIRFYWAGRGSTGTPYRGVYGPLISAISAVSLDNEPQSRVNFAVLVEIMVGIMAILFLIFGILWRKQCLGRKNRTNTDISGLEKLQTGFFTLRQIKAATNNFSGDNKIGEGGFGPVYKGYLPDGTIIAVKQLSSQSRQGNREFLNEIGMISALQHPHLVKLYGCCIEDNQLSLVYEFLENNNLARALFGPERSQLKLDWTTRHMICVGVARGLTYLHEESRLKVVHRDIKATNILLDKNLCPKISDFGLAKLGEEDDTHISTRIAGTYGYMAPEYAMYGHLTEKADIYSFGIVALEIVSGRSNSSYRNKGECLYLLEWAYLLKEKGNLMDVVDPRLGSDIETDEAVAMINVALLCTSISPTMRPTMSSVVRMLLGDEQVPYLSSNVTIINDHEKEEDMNKHFMGNGKEDEQCERNLRSITSEATLVTSSPISAKDLYPGVWDSDY